MSFPRLPLEKYLFDLLILCKKYIFLESDDSCASSLALVYFFFGTYSNLMLYLSLTFANNFVLIHVHIIKILIFSKVFAVDFQKLRKRDKLDNLQSAITLLFTIGLFSYFACALKISVCSFFL